MNRKNQILCGIFLASFLGGTYGNMPDSPIVELTPYQVSSSRLAEITALEINAETLVPTLGFDLEEALNRMPGVFYQQVGGLAGPVEILIRGSEPNFTKTYVEGIEVNNPTDSRGGGYQLSRLDSSLYGTLDLGRGTHSAVQGSDAMGGILSIRFPEGDAAIDTTTFSGSVGFFGYEHADFAYGKTLGATSVNFKISHTAEDDRYEGNDFENQSGFLKLTHTIGEDQLLSMAVWSGKSEITRFPDDSGGPLYAESKDLDTLENEDLGLSAQYRRFFDKEREWTLLAGYYRDDSESNSPGVLPGPRNPVGVPGNSFDDTFERFQFETHFRAPLGQSIEGVIGASFKQETGESDSSIILPFGALPGHYDESRAFLAAFAEGVIRLPADQQILIAQRVDKVDEVSAEWSPSVKYTKAFSSTDRFYLAYNHGFKVPSLFALNNAMVGNQDLNSERVNSFEAGFTKSLIEQRLALSLIGFYQDYGNLIDMSEVTQTLINLSDVTSKGLEATLSWSMTDSLRFTFEATRMNLELNDPEEILRYRPETMLGCGFEWQAASDTLLTCRYSMVGRRWDSSIPTGNVRLDSHSRFSLSLSHRFSEHARVVLSGYNLLNEKEETAIGYEDPGANLRLSFQLSL